jgi:hypothetical protein
VDLDIGFKRSSGPEQNKEYFNTGEIPVRVYMLHMDSTPTLLSLNLGLKPPPGLKILFNIDSSLNALCAL